MDAFYGFLAQVLALAWVAFMLWEWYDETQKKKAANGEPMASVEMKERVQEDERHLK